MRSSVLVLLPCAMLLTACTNPITPAFKDIGSRSGPCVSGGPDSVAQQFYDSRMTHKHQDRSAVDSLRPYLSDALYQQLRQERVASGMRGDIFTSGTESADSVEVASSSTIPNTDARNIPLRVTFTKGSQRWQDEVLMIREGQCWAIDDIRYLGTNHAPAGTLRQSIEAN